LIIYSVKSVEASGGHISNDSEETGVWRRGSGTHHTTVGAISNTNLFQAPASHMESLNMVLSSSILAQNRKTGGQIKTVCLRIYVKILDNMVTVINDVRISFPGDGKIHLVGGCDSSSATYKSYKVAFFK
jgi:hypothetical protein